jgi:DNA-binding MarR family transcriptional regulator
MQAANKRNVANEILRVIPKVMRVLASEIRQEPSSLAPAHFRVMFVLAKRPRSLTELADSQSVSMATMSNSISVLVDRGWVARRKDPHDRRRLALEITAKGQDVLHEAHNRVEGRLRGFLASISDQECSDLLQGLELLNGVFSSH